MDSGAMLVTAAPSDNFRPRPSQKRPAHGGSDNHQSKRAKYTSAAWYEAAFFVKLMSTSAEVQVAMPAKGVNRSAFDQTTNQIANAVSPMVRHASFGRTSQSQPRRGRRTRTKAQTQLTGSYHLSHQLIRYPHH